MIKKRYLLINIIFTYFILSSAQPITKQLVTPKVITAINWIKDNGIENLSTEQKIEIAKIINSTDYLITIGLEEDDEGITENYSKRKSELNSALVKAIDDLDYLDQELIINILEQLGLSQDEH